MQNYGMQQALSEQGGQQGVQQATQPSWQDGYRTAQLVQLPDLELVLGSHAAALVTDTAAAIGCPREHVLLPLLTCCAGLMGRRASVRVHGGWQEPAVLWTLVAARPGSRRSAVLRHLVLALQELQQEQDRVWQLSRPSSTPHTPPHPHTPEQSPRRLMAGVMNHTELVQALLGNQGEAICLLEDVEALLQQLGVMTLTPKGEGGGRTDLQALHEGLPLHRVQEGRLESTGSTCFNHGGFVSPQCLTQLMLKEPAWLGSRYLIACPPAHSPATFGCPLPGRGSVAPALGAVFQSLYTYHQQPRHYHFTEDGLAELRRFNDEEWSTVLVQLDLEEQNGGVVGKTLGHVVRLAGVLKALRCACAFAAAGASLSRQTEFRWEVALDREAALAAILLGKFCLEQKLALSLMLSQNYFQYRHHGPALAQPPSHAPPPVSSQGLGPPPQHALHAAPQQHVPPALLPGMPFAPGLPPSPALAPLGKEDLDMAALPVGPEEDVGVLMQSAEFMHMDKTQFVSNYVRRIKRLLECYDDGNGVSATTAAQKSIAPPVRVQGTNNRHPAWASALFFHKVAELGLGQAEQVKHPTNRKVYWRFKRKPVSELTEKNRQLLAYLRVDMSLYSKFGHPAFFQQHSGFLAELPQTFPPSSSPVVLEDDSSSALSPKPASLSPRANHLSPGMSHLSPSVGVLSPPQAHGVDSMAPPISSVASSQPAESGAERDIKQEAME